MINPEELDLQEMTPIPPNCEGCGVQCELRSRLLGLLTVKQVTEWKAGKLVGQAGLELDDMIDELMPGEEADLLKRTLRQMTGSELEEIDDTIDETQQEIQSNARACSGVLKMRATKGDVTYTAGVCTSPKQYVRDGKTSHLAVHIAASSSNKN